MARYENKKMNRVFDRSTGKDLFFNERGSVSYDLSNMRFLWSGVDTIRQLYNCVIKQDVFAKISSYWEEGAAFIHLGDIDWKISSSGKRSGYKFILKNLEEGFVVLLKSFYCDAQERGAHLKIEATPQIIHELGLEQLTKRLREIGSIFADTLEASGVAVHMALDIKGLELPDTFEFDLVTRSKRVMKAHGISNASFSANEANFSYGRGQTYTFGESSGIQLCVYDKTLEAAKSDKLDFCEMLWKCCPSVDDPFLPEYNDGRETGEADTVHRVEFRVHHSIIKEFENGHFNHTQVIADDGTVIKPGEQVFLREAVDLKPHLEGIFLYCLNIYRLQHSTSYIHPIWQKIEEDIRWFGIAKDWLYTRSVKKKPGIVSKRNVAMWMGNYIRLAARQNFTVDFVVNYFLQSGLEADLCSYFGLLNYGESDLLFLSVRDFIERRLLELRIEGRAA